MVKKLLSLGVSFIWAMNFVQAQQDPLYALYLNNPITINPAYAGLNNNFNAIAGFRKQWTGFDGAPSTFSFTTHSSLHDNKMGAGLEVVEDNIGNNTTTQLTGIYAYKVQLTQSQTLSFGMQAGLMNYRSDAGKLNLADPSDPVFGSVSQLKPTLGAGAMLKSDRYLVGISVPRLLNSSFNVNGQAFKVYQQNYYLFGSYLFFVSERIWFKPSVLIKAIKGSPISADVNFNINIDRNYTLGIYTRNLNSFGALAQISFLEYYKVAYAFELPGSKSIGTKYNTNEINIGIRLSILRAHDRSVSNF